MLKIKVGQDILEAAQGEILSEVLRKYHKFVEQPCGGNGTCGKCKVLVDGEEALSCKYVVQSDISVELLEKGEIASVSGVKEEGKRTEHICLVLDLGTTTLAMALVSLDDKNVISVTTRTNPQIAYGADVMSRIDFCMKNSVVELQEVLVAEINHMIESVCESASCHMVDTSQQSEMSTLYVAGNATMLHILFGVDPSTIGVAPYKAVFLEEKCEKASSLGINGVQMVQVLPSISSFVGADLVAGMNYVGMPGDGKYNLLVDLGTNAEVVLFSKRATLCTAAAAGPCFEGANITYGMSAIAGAVSEFKIATDVADDQRMTGEVKHNIVTIGNVTPTGICGTGLVDIISELVKHHIIDETGYMECEEYKVAEGVFLNQKDVRQFQLAKSAVYSAIVTLMKIQDVSFDEIEHLYISGGFSAKINVKNAMRVGLLPKKLLDKCSAINNSSLLGTISYALEQNELSEFVTNAMYVDLAMDSCFAELFIENMEFIN